MTAHPAQPEATPPAPVTAWHRVVAAHHRGDGETRDVLLAALLAPDVVFRSPAVHTPQQGRDLTTAYLRAAMVVLGPTLAYERQLLGPQSAALEFTAELDGLRVHGIDLMQWGDDGRLVEFTVLVRPLRGLHKLVELMQAQLTHATPTSVPGTAPTGGDEAAPDGVGA